jgi:type VI secretion system secreted protein Hcp
MAVGESIYGTFKGQKQGDIRGGVTLRGREGSLAIKSFGNGIEIPVDPASGRGVVHGQHQPSTFSMQMDQATPLLINALTNHENITRSIFNFWRTDTTGTETNYYSIELTNAQLVSYHALATGGAEHLVTFGLVYQKITWTWIKGGITASDDWIGPE